MHANFPRFSLLSLILSSCLSLLPLSHKCYISPAGRFSRAWGTDIFGSETQCMHAPSLKASRVADIFHFCTYKVIIIILVGVTEQGSIHCNCQPPINIPLLQGNPRSSRDLQFTQLTNMWTKPAILSFPLFPHLLSPPSLLFIFLSLHHCYCVSLCCLLSLSYPLSPAFLPYDVWNLSLYHVWPPTFFSPMYIHLSVRVFLFISSDNCCDDTLDWVQQVVMVGVVRLQLQVEVTSPLCFVVSSLPLLVALCLSASPSKPSSCSSIDFWGALRWRKKKKKNRPGRSKLLQHLCYTRNVTPVCFGL